MKAFQYHVIPVSSGSREKEFAANLNCKRILSQLSPDTGLRELEIITTSY